MTTRQGVAARYHPQVNYFPTTACPEVFYNSHSTSICQAIISFISMILLLAVIDYGVSAVQISAS